MKHPLSDLGVIVMSCDGYSDAWNAFFKLFFKYWPDCPCNIYLVAEDKPINDERIVDVLPGKLEWSHRLLTTLERMPESKVLLLQEDYLLMKPVMEDGLAEALSLFQKGDVALTKVFPLPEPDAAWDGHAKYGQLSRSFPHRITTQAAIWDKAFLQEIANKDENVWDFEAKGSLRAQQSDKLFLGILKNNEGRLDNGHYPYTYTQSTGIVKGKWAYEIVALNKKEQLGLDPNVRAFEKGRTAWLRKAPLSLRRPIEFVLYRTGTKKLLFP